MSNATPNTTVFGTIQNSTKIQIRTDTSTSSPAIISRDRESGNLLEAIRSKMVADPNPISQREKGTTLSPDQGYIDAIAADTNMTVSQSRGLLDALPDLELSKLIIVSSILSPNDMLSTELIYGCSTKIFGDATQSLVAVIKDYFDDVYKIKKQLPDIIGKAIFTDGSYALAIFPETAIDAAINSNLKISRESITTLDNDIKEPLWILGNRDSKLPADGQPKNLMTSFESAYSLSSRVEAFDNTVGDKSLCLTVGDNPSIMRMPAMLKRIRRRSIVGKYDKRTYSAEFYARKYNDPSSQEQPDGNIDHIYPSRIANNVNLIDMSALEGDERNVGHPVVFTPQVVIPVFEPGAPANHVGYFIPLDETGNPLSTIGYEDQFLELQNMANGSKQNTGSAGTGSGYANYENVSSVLSADQDQSPTNPAEAAKLYGSVIENELAERLKNGDYNEKHTIAKATSVYRMMFTRACQSLGTQLLYVPSEYMTYFAYDYHDNGTGRSLIEKTKSISSMRMINLMATSMAAIKNAINNRKVEVTLDPDDPDPMKTFEQHMHEFARATQSEFPIGKLSYSDITESLQRAGVSVSVTGHPGVPETRMEVSTSQGSYAGADSDLDDRLTRQNIMGFGIPPDSVNSATEMEFDKNVVAYNNLSNKINMVRQETTCEHVSDFIQKYTRNSTPLINKLKEIIQKNRDTINGGADVKQISDEKLAMIFINYIDIGLPEADTSKTAAELEAFNAYSDALEAFLDAFISDDMMAAEIMGEEVGNAVRSMRPVIKGHFLRRYLSNKNIAPELFSLVATGDMENEYFDILDQHEEYVQSIMPAFKKFIIRTMQMGNQGDGVILAAKSILEQIKEARAKALEGEAGGYVDDSSGGDNDDNDAGGDGGDDDFGDDDDEENDDGDGDSDSGEDGDEDGFADDFDLDEDEDEGDGDDEGEKD